MSKIQRLNIELKSIDEENKRIQEEVENLKSNLSVINEDQDKEKSIIIDANSNEKRLKEENELIEIDARYYDTEKSSNEDLDASKILNKEIENIKVFITDGKKDEALIHLDKCKEYIESYAINFGKNQNIKNESIKRKERINVIDTEIFS